MAHLHQQGLRSVIYLEDLHLLALDRDLPCVLSNSDSEHARAIRVHGELVEVTTISIPAGHLPGLCSRLPGNEAVSTSGQANSHSGMLQESIGSRDHDRSSGNTVGNTSSSSTSSSVLLQSPEFGNQVTQAANLVRVCECDTKHQGKARSGMVELLQY